MRPSSSGWNLRTLANSDASCIHSTRFLKQFEIVQRFKRIQDSITKSSNNDLLAQQLVLYFGRQKRDETFGCK